MASIEGILPALITPMNGAGEINPAVLQKLVNHLFDQGVAGLYLCGTSGEGLLLSVAERQRVVELVIEAAAGRGKLIVHVGAIATEDSVALARHAEKAGADGVSSVPPFAYGRDVAGMELHYRAIAKACSLPLYLYNIPSVTSIHVTAEMVRPLLDLPNIKGLKFSDSNLFAEFRLIELGKEFDVFHGCDETLIAALMFGAVGGIGLTYNFMPRLYVELFRRFKAGDMAGANQLQLRASRWIEVFLSHARANQVGLAKAYMGELGFDCGAARAPNPPVGASALKAFVRELEERKLDVSNI